MCQVAETTLSGLQQQVLCLQNWRYAMVTSALLRARSMPSLAVIAENIGHVVKREQRRIFAGLIKKQALPKHFRTFKNPFACLRSHADVGVRGVRCIVRGRAGQRRR